VTSFQAPTGTRDVLAPGSARGETLVRRSAHRAPLTEYGLRVSLVSEVVLSRGVGKAAHHRELVECAQLIPTILELLG
jgi:hypothetical protein